jgi:glycosyltransferase involved in cell wall biosynthesis
MTTMNIAVDTNCILPGKVGGIEDYTVALIEALCLPGSPAKRVFLLTRPENRDLFAAFAGEWPGRCELIDVPRPIHRGEPVGNWAELWQQSPQQARRLQLAFAQAKIRLLDAADVDLVHFPGNSVNPLELPFPVVLNLHDLQHRHFPEYFTEGEIENRERWWSASAFRADSLLAASNWIANDLQAQLGVEKQKVFVTPEPMRLAHAAEPSLAFLAGLRKRLKLPISFFIYPAAAWPHKNHDRLLRAFAAANLSGVPLLLTGGGQDDSPLAGLIESLGLVGKARLMGRVSTEDLAGLYRLATALIFPSQYEAWSLPITEAMQAGCPVASSSVTSLPEQVGDAALLFAADDIAAMQSAMKRLAGDSALRQTLRERGWERIKQFTTARFQSALTDAYAHATRAFAARKAA